MNIVKKVPAKIATSVLTLLFAVSPTSLLAVPQAGPQSSIAKGKPTHGPVLRQPAPPDLRVELAPGAAPYVLTTIPCSPSAPALTFSVQVANIGGSASPAPPAAVLYAADSSLNPAWMGAAPLPAIDPGRSVMVSVPVMAYVPAAAMGGSQGVTRSFRLLIRGAPSYQGANKLGSMPLQIQVAIPAYFCQGAPTRPPQQAPKAATPSAASTTLAGTEYQTGGSNGQHAATGGAGAGKLGTGGQVGQVSPVAPGNSTSKMSAAELKARLKGLPAARKAGPITTMPDTPNKIQHTAVLALLQKQWRTAEIDRRAVLPAASSALQTTATSVSLSPSAAGSGPASLPPSGGNLQVGSGQNSRCPNPQIVTVNGLPVPLQSAGSSTPPKGGVRQLGQNGGTATKSQYQGPSAWFTTVPEYNLYTIQGCGFGSNQGAVFLTGPFHNQNPGMIIASWNDAQIVASLPPYISGEPDIIGDVTLVIYPQGSSTIQAAGFTFYAIRVVQPMYVFPASQANAQALVDSAGNPVSAAETPQIGNYFGGGYDPNSFVSVEVDRIGTVPFASAQDSFSFSKMPSAFYVDKYQLFYLDVTNPNSPESCIFADAQATIDSNGNWTAAWDSQSGTLRVTAKEQHCHITSAGTNLPTDFSISVYAIAFWVVGPKGVFPWPNSL